MDVNGSHCMRGWDARMASWGCDFDTNVRITLLRGSNCGIGGTVLDAVVTYMPERC